MKRNSGGHTLEHLESSCTHSVHDWENREGDPISSFFSTINVSELLVYYISEGFTACLEYFWS